MTRSNPSPEATASATTAWTPTALEAARSALERSLREVGSLREMDAGMRLVRQLEKVLAVLERPLVASALEYARRCRAEGARRARIWYLRRDRRESARRALAPIPAYTEVPQTRDAVVRSRSRRLRAPPA